MYSYITIQYALPKEFGYHYFSCSSGNCYQHTYKEGRQKEKLFENENSFKNSRLFFTPHTVYSYRLKKAIEILFLCVENSRLFFTPYTVCSYHYRIFSSLCNLLEGISCEPVLSSSVWPQIHRLSSGSLPTSSYSSPECPPSLDHPECDLKVSRLRVRCQ